MQNHANHLECLQEAVGYRFNDTGLLSRALVHRSYANENTQLELGDNETLEFLGDAVLGLCVSHFLLERFPKCNEGELSRLRSSMVNERELANLALSIGIGGCMMLGKGEELTGGRQKPSILADCLEALFASIYLDGGLSAVQDVVETLFAGYLGQSDQDNTLQTLDKDFKTQLQELTHARFKLAPDYALEGEEGPDHNKRFFVSVSLGDRILSRGVGKNKKEAQQQAAKKALEVILQNGCVYPSDM